MCRFLGGWSVSTKPRHSGARRGRGWRGSSPSFRTIIVGVWPPKDIFARQQTRLGDLKAGASSGVFWRRRGWDAGRAWRREEGQKQLWSPFGAPKKYRSLRIARQELASHHRLGWVRACATRVWSRDPLNSHPQVLKTQAGKVSRDPARKAMIRSHYYFPTTQ